MTLAPPAPLAVVGLGHVGLPLAAKLAEAGFDVTGIEVDEAKVAAIEEGRNPLPGDEPGLDELVAEVVDAGRLTATTDASAVAECGAVFVNVQTPLAEGTHRPDHGVLESALSSIAPHLSEGTLVLVESTIAPGTTRDVVVPTLEKGSGLTVGEDLDVVHCPERVMPGKLISNLVRYDRVVGGWTPAAAERAAELYGQVVEGELTLTDAATAEVVKTAENAYRDVQIAFANELARICEGVGADFLEVRELVNEVEGRNVLFAGAGVGGHCIPKDIWLLAAAAPEGEAPLLAASRAVNDAMPGHTVRLVLDGLGEAGVSAEGARVTLLGASYLPGSGDTRATPALPVAEGLAEAGAEVTVHDPFAPDLEGFPVTRDLAAALEDADAVVLVTAHDVYRDLAPAELAGRMAGRVVVDGRHVFDPAALVEAEFVYRGVGRGKAGRRTG